MRLTTHFHLVHKLEMCGTAPRPRLGSWLGMGTYPVSLVFEVGHHAARCHLNSFVYNVCPSLLKISKVERLGCY